MCGRFTLTTPVSELVRIFRAERLDDSLRPDAAEPAPRYNIAPTEAIVVLRRAGGGGPRELARLRWGLIPEWVEDPSDWPLLINARAESLDEKPAFRDAVRARRCLVLADGFYEWRAEGGRKQPYHVRPRSEGPIAFAGLWERLQRPGEEAVESCAIVTTDANELLRPIHDRMPVILAPDARERWLDPAVDAYEELEDALRPPPSESLAAYPVSPRVNRVENDDPSCIEPIGEPEATPDEAPAGDRARRGSGGRDETAEDAGTAGSGRAREAEERDAATPSPQLELL